MGKKSRIMIGNGILDTVGIHGAQAVITWVNNTETSPDPHEFKVVEVWS